MLIAHLRKINNKYRKSIKELDHKKIHEIEEEEEEFRG